MSRYFELIDPDGGRAVFWEVALDGPCIVSWSGPVGTAGSHERELCASEPAAADELARRIAERAGQGYRECADRRLDARTQALEAAIDADPDDPTPYLIYADWIQTLGDPRGELIVAQHASGGDARPLLEQRADVFLGPLADQLDGLLRLRWFCGFIAGARILPDDSWVQSGHRIVEQLMDHPSARWLRELAIDIVDDYSATQHAVAVIAARSRPHVHTLDIGHCGRAYAHASSRRYGRVDLGPLWSRLPGLRRLTVRGDPGRLGTLALPELAHVTFHCRDIWLTVARAIAEAACPALRRLELRGSGGELAPTLEAIVHGTVGPQLVHLVVHGCPDGNRVCDALARARLPALRELQVTNCHVSRSGAEALARSTLALDILDVSYNALPRDLGLDRVAKLVVADS